MPKHRYRPLRVEHDPSPGDLLTRDDAVRVTGIDWPSLAALLSEHGVEPVSIDDNEDNPWFLAGDVLRVRTMARDERTSAVHEIDDILDSTDAH